MKTLLSLILATGLVFEGLSKEPKNTEKPEVWRTEIFYQGTRRTEYIVTYKVGEARKVIKFIDYKSDKIIDKVYTLEDETKFRELDGKEKEKEILLFDWHMGNGVA